MAEKYEPKANRLNLCNGYIFPMFLTKEWLEKASNSFTPRDTDIFVSSFPKSGTHWLAHIVYLIKKREKLSQSYLPNHAIFFDSPPQDEDDSPPIKITKGDVAVIENKNPVLMTESQIEAIPDPRFFFTHFPFPYLPKTNPNTKFLYIYRNPKDLVLSMYNHFSNDKRDSFQGTFDEFFEFFIEKNCFNYSNHIKTFIEHKSDPNLYIISYEELHTDFKNKIGEIAKFLECELTEELYELVVKETNFEAMRENKFINGKYIMKEGTHFINKGKVGNWKTNLTQEQSTRIDMLINSQLEEEFVKKYISYSGLD